MGLPTRLAGHDPCSARPERFRELDSSPDYCVMVVEGGSLQRILCEQQAGELPTSLFIRCFQICGRRHCYGSGGAKVHPWLRQGSAVMVSNSCRHATDARWQVAHVEDVVVDASYRGHSLGKR